METDPQNTEPVIEEPTPPNKWRKRVMITISVLAILAVYVALFIYLKTVKIRVDEFKIFLVILIVGPMLAAFGLVGRYFSKFK